jgi:hypothetical protein
MLISCSFNCCEYNNCPIFISVSIAFNLVIGCCPGIYGKTYAVGFRYTSGGLYYILTATAKNAGFFTKMGHTIQSDNQIFFGAKTAEKISQPSAKGP